VAVIYLTQGVGSSILHEDTKGYFARREEFKGGISLLMGMPMDDQELRIPYPASPDDISGCMALIQEVKASFPGLDETNYENQLAGYIKRNEAWVIRDDGRIAAALLCSKDRQEIDFLAVAPEYRRKGLAERLVETAAAQFPVKTELSVVTYREGEPLGEAARMFYTVLDFVPREITRGHKS
jgi:ribosomal protein S18 acetylase RimI-like enzyme